MKAWQKVSMGMLVWGIAGCLSVSSFDRKVKSWVGENASDLKASWGEPQNVIQTQGEQLYLYQWTGANYARVWSPGEPFPSDCKVWFTLDEKEIVSAARWEGGTCQSGIPLKLGEIRVGEGIP